MLGINKLVQESQNKCTLVKNMLLDRRFHHFLLSTFFLNTKIKLTNPTLNKLDSLQIDRYSHLSCNVSNTLDEITEGLNSLRNSESKRPDDIAAVLLYQCRQFLSIPLFILFNESLYRGIFSTV